MKKGTNLKIDDDSYTVVVPQLGQGGAGTVSGVRSSANGKVYALKRIQKDARPARNKRFLQEIQFGLDSNNDHVVRIHAQSEDEKYFYYTMDLYPTNLREIMQEEPDYRILLEYLSQLCDGLAYVHDQGVVHRDIKPENILVDQANRRIVLADFGIAHFKDSSLTQQADLLANRNYQAPEQMVKNNAKNVGKPADVFALGLIFTEVFTQQNPRGARPRRVGDTYPFLSNLDSLVTSMTLQDESQRVTIQAARDSLKLIRKQLDASIKKIAEELHPVTEPLRGDSSKAELILNQAATDVLSAKYIFERTTDMELSRYNPNYHCQISYRVSDELYNGCVQSVLYSMCKAKFEYEASATWSESDLDFVVSPLKAQLLDELRLIQSQYPLARNSIWTELPRRTAHYFRFCKDYHCEEILRRARRELTRPRGPYDGSLHSNLMNAPILWIAQNVRRYLKTDLFEISSQNLHEIEFDRQVSVDWEETNLDDLTRTSIGINLFDPTGEAEILAVLEKFSADWNATFIKQDDGNYLIHFRSCDDFECFSKEALAIAVQDYVFEGDVLDLLRTEDEYGELVVLTWGSTFEIPNTLAKVLGLRDINALRS